MVDDVEERRYKPRHFFVILDLFPNILFFTSELGICLGQPANIVEMIFPTNNIGYRIRFLSWLVFDWRADQNTKIQWNLLAATHLRQIKSHLNAFGISKYFSKRENFLDLQPAQRDTQGPIEDVWRIQNHSECSFSRQLLTSKRSSKYQAVIEVNLISAHFAV